MRNYILLLSLLIFSLPVLSLDQTNEKLHYEITGVVQQQMQNSCLQMAKQVLPIRIYTRLSQEVSPVVSGQIEEQKKQLHISYAIPEISIRAYKLPEKASFDCTFLLGDLGRMQLLEFGITSESQDLINRLHRYYWN